MEGPRPDKISEVSQTEKDRYHMIPFIAGVQNDRKKCSFTKEKGTHRLRKQTVGDQR